MNFKKGFVEISAGHSKVDKPSKPELCEKFSKALLGAPDKMKDFYSDFFGDEKPMDYMLKRSKEINFSKSEDEAGDSSDKKEKKDKKDKKDKSDKEDKKEKKEKEKKEKKEKKDKKKGKKAEDDI